MLRGKVIVRRYIESSCNTFLLEQPVQFRETDLSGVWVIEPKRNRDSRGFFTRTFCGQQFSAHGLHNRFVQHSTSYTRAKASLRGMHFQRTPHSEIKVVRCVRGTVFDVIVDLRVNSSTFCSWREFELSAENGRQLYIPEGFAHGFQTLTDAVEVGYLISEFYTPSAAAGVRFDDPAFKISWPLPVTVISDKDETWPDFRV